MAVSCTDHWLRDCLVFLVVGYFGFWWADAQDRKQWIPRRLWPIFAMLGFSVMGAVGVCGLIAGSVLFMVGAL